MRGGAWGGVQIVEGLGNHRRALGLAPTGRQSPWRVLTDSSLIGPSFNRTTWLPGGEQTEGSRDGEASEEWLLQPGGRCWRLSPVWQPWGRWDRV